MRYFIFALLLLLFPTVSAFAQGPEVCNDLDMSDPAAIKACLESDETWYEARTKPMFEPNKECSHLQMQVVKRQIEAIDPQRGRRVNSKTLDDESIPRPDCETVSKVVELIRGRPSAWSSCLGYEETPDKFSHFKACLVGYLGGRYGTDEMAAYSRISGMDCKRATATYQKALGLIHPARQDQGQFMGRRVPASYADPDCAQVETYVQAVKDDVEAVRAEQYAEAQAAKAERKKIEEQKAKEYWEKKKKTAEFHRKMEESYQKSLDKMSAAGLESRKKREDPKDAIEGKHIHLALVKHIWDQRPEEEKEFGGIKARLSHTTHGFKTWSSTPMMPNIFHAVKDIDIKECDVRNGKAHCSYGLTVSTRTVYKDQSNQARADVYGNFMNMFTGPRSYTWESDFIHDGKQWTAKLSSEQRKLLLPPEIDMSDQRSEQEKVHCDVMSAMGIPMLC